VQDFLSDREPRLIDFWVDPAENVYPIVPPGASLAEMVVEPPHALVEEEALDDLWAV
jgi:thiamine pyrophosphate-dependent acetolactate synthase large subunit-like protein